MCLKAREILGPGFGVDWTKASSLLHLWSKWDVAKIIKLLVAIVHLLAVVAE